MNERFANPNNPEWKWKITCYYNDTVKYPKVPGEIAIETVHDSDSSKDMEVLVCENRNDITYTITQLRE